MQTKRLKTIGYYLGIVGYNVGAILSAAWLKTLLGLSLFSFPFNIIGIPIAAFGLFLIFWCAWLLFKIGRGTVSLFDPTKKLVIRGPYKAVRNPIYIGQFLFFAGIGIFLDLEIIFPFILILALFLHVLLVKAEEPTLRKRFGREWVDYANQVPRWFPRILRKQSSK
jgi:protein-S-isoprenylcysteine O-methyltransferase Ste14